MLTLDELCEWLNIRNGTRGNWSSETRFHIERWPPAPLPRGEVEEWSHPARRAEPRMFR